MSNFQGHTNATKLPSSPSASINYAWVNNLASSLRPRLHDCHAIRDYVISLRKAAARGAPITHGTNVCMIHSRGHQAREGQRRFTLLRETTFLFARVVWPSMPMI
ncbi:hypothetical protein BV22DRAFT_805902 [Leucogyrophana mollusca]|uniref:Uncharacterized protein n=1 Tax=Leucogyrophana mollusca TaxID=85980 RepID=A0ACB8B5N4_9AGAM|nr:hypothetical protein BV22DRAFT_805902 [Leucogyrophana mollusca]